MRELDRVTTVADYLKCRLQEKPDIALVLGSGLGELAEKIETPVFIPYADVPDFPTATAPGHTGRFVAGRLQGKNILCMQGRFHYYEGHSMQEIALPVRVLKTLGCRALVLTNAAGGVNQSFSVGDIMLITDHINFMGANPLRGANEDSFGPRFCDMTRVYDPDLRELARQTASKLKLSIREGVYLGYMGPSFETPAEIRAFRTLGADAVGMSTVPEAIAAAHCGLPVLGLSLITNMAAGMTQQRLSGDEVLAISKERGPLFQALVSEIIAVL